MWRRTELKASVLPACTGRTLNIARAPLRLVGGLPSHFCPSKGIFTSAVTRSNNADMSHVPDLVPSSPQSQFVLLVSPDSATTLSDLPTPVIWRVNTIFTRCSTAFLATTATDNPSGDLFVCITALEKCCETDSFIEYARHEFEHFAARCITYRNIGAPLFLVSS